jgi:nucleoside phosphorylase
VHDDDLEHATTLLLALANDAKTVRAHGASLASQAANLAARVARIRRDLNDGTVAREQSLVERAQVRFAVLALVVDIESDLNAVISIAEPVIACAIMTAIEVERRAVCGALAFDDQHRVRRGTRVYWRGCLPLCRGGSYEVVVAQSADMANVDAALLASDMIHHWNPAAALLVGIAASTKAEVRLGDVVIGSDVYYYERGKEDPEGTKPEPRMIPADATLWSNVAAVPDWDGRVPVLRPDEADGRAGVHRGVILSGERVIADANERDRLAALHRKALAIEMEGYGFSRAMWQSFERVRHLVIRGICDNGNAVKDDRWHNYAAASAAAFAVHFLMDGPIVWGRPD